MPERKRRPRQSPDGRTKNIARPIGLTRRARLRPVVVSGLLLALHGLGESGTNRTGALGHLGDLFGGALLRFSYLSVRANLTLGHVCIPLLAFAMSVAPIRSRLIQLFLATLARRVSVMPRQMATLLAASSLFCVLMPGELCDFFSEVRAS